MSGGLVPAYGRPTPARRWRWLGMTVALGLLALGLVVLRPEPARAASPSMSIALSQSSTSGRIGSTLVLTATVMLDGSATAAGSGWAVEFSGSTGWRSGIVRTGRDGTASYAHVDLVAETERISATLITDGCSGVRPASVQHQWWRPVLTLDIQSFGSGDVPRSAALTATLRHGSTAIANTKIDITIVNGVVQEGFEPPSPDDRISRTLTTDGSGQVHLLWQRTFTSYDTIVAVERNDVAPARAQAMWSWGYFGPWSGARLVLDGPDAQRVGSPARLTASLEAAGEGSPAAPENYAVRVFDAAGKVISDYIPFNAGTGHAVITLNSESARVDGLAVRLYFVQDYGDGYKYYYVEDTEFHVVDWYMPELMIESAEAVTGAGGPATLTATVAHEGRPLSGLSLRVAAVRNTAGLTDLARIGRTDASGHTTVSWTRSRAGRDTIQVVEQGAAIPVGSAGRHTWLAQAPALPITLDLTQSSVTSPVGGTVQLAVQVRLAGGASPSILAGTDVVLAASPGDWTSGDLQTDAGGAVATSFTSDVAGSVSFGAALLIGGCGAAGAPPITHIWTTETPPSTPPPTTPTEPTPTPIPSPSPTVTPTPTATPTPTPSGTPTSTPTTPPTTPPDNKGSDTGHPGGDVTIVGQGCAPGATVVVFLGNTRIAQGPADADGHYAVRGAVPDMPLGRYQTRSSCGSPSQAVLDLTISRSAGAPAGAVGATTAGILVFFLLVGHALLQSRTRP